jgi:hypothetical protein
VCLTRKIFLQNIEFKSSLHSKATGRRLDANDARLGQTETALIYSGVIHRV